MPRELSSSQHEFIKRQIFLIPVYLWVVWAWSIFVVQLPAVGIPARMHVVRDFAHFYAQGVITRHHDAHALYDIHEMAAVVERVVPEHLDAAFPPVYGPQVGLFFSPFATLPYLPAMYAWFGVTVIGYAVCVFLIWRCAPSLARSRSTVVAFALGAPGLHFALSYGQASIIGLMCFSALWLALRSGRPFAAGLAVGALAYKPQLGIVAAFVFVLAKEWRVVAGAVVAVGLQVAASWAYWGSAIFPAYIRALMKLPDVLTSMEPDTQMMYSWRAFFLYLGLSPTAAFALMTVTVLATLVFAVWCWRAGGDAAPRFVVLTLATLLVDPHNQAYDLLILGPALLVAWDWANRCGAAPLRELLPWVRTTLVQLTVGKAIVGLALFVYVAPILTIVLPTVPVQWTVVSFLLLGGVLGRQLMKNSGVDTLSPTTIQEVHR